MLIFRSLILVLALCSCSVFAASVREEEDRLARYEQVLENHISELEDIENQLFALKSKLKEASTEVAKSNANFEEARQANTAASIKLAGDNNDDNKRAAKLAAHSLKMAERGVRTRSKRLERIQANQQELQAAEAALQSKLVSAKDNITAQEQRIVDVKRAEDLAAKALLAKAEAESVKLAAKADQEARQAARKAELAAAKAALEAEAKAKQQAPVVTNTLSELDQEALAYAQKEVAKLEKLLASGKPGRPIFDRLTLTGSKIEPQKFEFLGRDQYRTEAVVSAGKQLFEVGGNKYRRTIPSSDDGEAYVFIVDAKRPMRPRLVMYKKSLLSN